MFAKVHFDSHCAKSVQIRVFSGPYFPAFGLKTERYSVSLRIQSECRKIRTRKNSVSGHFSSSEFLGSKRNNQKSNFHSVAMSMMKSQTLKFLDFIITQKSRYFENETFILQIKKFINYTSRATL